ncbi:MAG: hypothetical protein IKQ89_03990 [Muribaculaceae bacterium]|nr:hypothetical protein [Muribaculaceae bacterium]
MGPAYRTRQRRKSAVQMGQYIDFQLFRSLFHDLLSNLRLQNYKKFISRQKITANFFHPAIFTPP